MISIISITIENFQSHSNTKLEFEKGLNVIIGPSDQGKSAVIRAIKWVLFNEPRGLEYIRHGETTAKVTIEFSNGRTVIRERSKSKNRYTVVDENGGSLVLEGFGNDVPEEVIKAHGIPKVVLDTDISSALNISDQLEGPFLLSETGAVRAKAIGRLTGIHIIDNSIRDCLADLRRENQSKERISNDIREVESRLEKYYNLEEIGENLNALDSVIKKAEVKISKRALLESRKASFDALNKEIEDVLKKLSILKDLNDCEFIIKNIELRMNALKSASRIKTGLTEVDSGIRSCDGIIRKTSSLDETLRTVKILEEKKQKVEKAVNVLGKINEWNRLYKDTSKYIDIFERIPLQEDIISKAGEKITALKKLTDLSAKYVTVLNQINEGNKYMEQNMRELKKMTEEYKKKLKVLGKCPLCDSKLDEFKLSDIIKHYEEVH